MATSSGSSTAWGGKAAKIKAITRARQRKLNMAAYSREALGTPF